MEIDLQVYSWTVDKFLSYSDDTFVHWQDKNKAKTV